MSARTTSPREPSDPRSRGAEERGSPVAAAVWLLTLPLLGVLSYLLGLALGVQGPDRTVLALACLLMVVGLAPIAIDQARPPRRRHLMLLLFCLAYLGTFVMPAFTYYIPASGPVDPPGVARVNLMPTDVARGLLVALAGLAAALAGYGLLASALRPRRPEEVAAHDWSASFCVGAGIAMLVFGGLIRVASLAGVIPAAAGTGVISALASATMYGTALLAIAGIRYRSRLAWLAIVVFVPLSSVVGFLTGSKRQTLIHLAIVVFAFILVKGRLRLWYAVALLLALVLLYPTAKFYRDEVLVGNTLTIVDAISTPDRTRALLEDFLGSSRGGEYLAEGFVSTINRLDGLGIESVIVRDTPSVSPYQNGRTLGLFFVAFVPRLFWPSKPEIAIGQWITDTYGSGPHITSHTGPSFLGDFYLNFGWLGVVGGMMLIGGLLGYFQVRHLGTRPSAPAVLVAVLLVSRIITRLIGSVAQTFAGAVLILAIILAIHTLFRLTSPRRTARPTTREEDASAAPSATPASAGHLGRG